MSILNGLKGAISNTLGGTGLTNTVNKGRTKKPTLKSAPMLGKTMPSNVAVGRKISI